MRLTGRRTGVALVAAAAALTATATAGSAAAAPDDALRRYIVVLDDGTDAGSVAAEHARTLGVVTGHVYSSALDGYAARMPAAVADQLADRPAGRLRAARQHGARHARRPRPPASTGPTPTRARPPASTVSTSGSTSTSR